MKDDNINRNVLMNENNNIRFCKFEKGQYCSVITGVSKLKSKNYKRSVICIKEKEKIYKIISVQANQRDGSLNIFFNYCKNNKAYSFQHKHKYKAGAQIIKKSLIYKKFIVDKTAKLSIHNSGFVQLSGKNILSGVDEKTGMAKGIGVFSSPLNKPVSSGPTFGIQCWGLNKGYQLLNNYKKDIQYIILNKEKNDFTERMLENKNPNTYLLEFFIFPPEANQFIYDYDNKFYIDHIIHNYLHKPGAIFAHPVLDLKFFSNVICLFPVLIKTTFAETHEYGYSLHSPGGSISKYDKQKTGNNFHLICYPNIKEKDLRSLQYGVDNDV